MKTLSTILVGLLFICFLFSGNAQTFKSSGLAPYSVSLDINQVNALFSNNNSSFWDQMGAPRYEVPIGSNKMSFFAHSFWMAGKDEDSLLHVAAHKYLENGQDFYPGPLYAQGPDRGTCDSSTSVLYNHIWEINRSEVNDFRYHFENQLMNGYSIPDNIISWPANGPEDCLMYLAPFFDYNQDGYYNPFDGDYPDMKGDKMLFWVYNDNTFEHSETTGLPLGIEVRCMAYAFNCDSLLQASNDVLNFTTFLSYQVINMSTFTYHDSYVGLFTDVNIGSLDDDYLGFDLNRNAIYFYNSDAIDGDGNGWTYGENPPAAATVLLNGITLDADGEDNPSSFDSNGNLVCDSYILNGNVNGFNFGNGIIDDEQSGFSKLMYFDYGVCSTCGPVTDEEYYSFLEGKWSDGQPLTYGGDGYASSGISSNYAYPGQTDQCGFGTNGSPETEWSEVTAGNTPGDRLSLGSIGPFTMDPGEFFNLDIAFVWSRDETTGSSLDKLFDDIDIIKTMYSTGSLVSCAGDIVMGSYMESEAIGTMKVYPSVTSDLIHLDLSGQQEYSVYQIINMQGNIVKSGNIYGTTCSIDVSQLSEGMYIIKANDQKNLLCGKFIRQ